MEGLLRGLLRSSTTRSLAVLRGFMQGSVIVHGYARGLTRRELRIESVQGVKFDEKV